MKIRAAEQPNGSVSVFADGDFLVFEGEVRPVEVEYTSDRGLSIATINLAATDAPIPAITGSLAGNYTARDEILGGFLDNLQELASTLIFEFNKIYSSGQGLTGLTEVSSEFAVDSEVAALDQVALPFTPVNGSFQVKVFNTRTGLTETSDIFVRLNGLNSDTTLESLAASINDIQGITATVTEERKLSITADSQLIEFGFGGDTSHVLAALGVNTFFSGTNARDISINEQVRADASKFAASEGGHRRRYKDRRPNWLLSPKLPLSRATANHLPTSTKIPSPKSHKRRLSRKRSPKASASFNERWKARTLELPALASMKKPST